MFNSKLFPACPTGLIFHLWGHMKELTYQENLQMQDEFIRCIMDSAAVLWNRCENTWKTCSVLTFERPCWHLYFSAWFVKNMLVEQKKREDYETKTAFCGKQNERLCSMLKKMHQISLFLKYIKWVSGVFFLPTNAGFVKVKMRLLVLSQCRRPFSTHNHFRMLHYNLKHNTIAV